MSLKRLIAETTRPIPSAFLLVLKTICGFYYYFFNIHANFNPSLLAYENFLRFILKATDLLRVVFSLNRFLPYNAIITNRFVDK